MTQLCGIYGARDELEYITTWVGLDDLTDVEIVALLAILRPALERMQVRQQNPPIQLELVRSGMRRRR